MTVSRLTSWGHQQLDRGTQPKQGRVTQLDGMPIKDGACAASATGRRDSCLWWCHSVYFRVKRVVVRVFCLYFGVPGGGQPKAHNVHRHHENHRRGVQQRNTTHTATTPLALSFAQGPVAHNMHDATSGSGGGGGGSSDGGGGSSSSSSSSSSTFSPDTHSLCTTRKKDAVWRVTRRPSVRPMKRNSARMKTKSTPLMMSMSGISCGNSDRQPTR
jgi:hypothetical protein